MATLHPQAGPAIQRAQRMGPLLAVIARELRERTDTLGRLLVQREAGGAGQTSLDAECAVHRSELRLAHRELARLGCRLVSLHPTVFSVAGTMSTLPRARSTGRRSPEATRLSSACLRAPIKCGPTSSLNRAKAERPPIMVTV